MKYTGVIKQSRTLDLAAVSAMFDMAALGFLAYSPEQLGLTVPIYAGIRIIITVAQVYLRFKTTGSVGEKQDA
jgi:hypothetical protein